ncbi:tetratricopeptide repeat protein [Pseudomonas cremoricolorata]|uniref:tetratricopeptide repeat protein n=1 Tax=Pseudomonas cremoricolorata TaxID=157783 RepID=UPI0012B66C45|nr:sel1 repeat family protein [Pseudomonas cremoricolorata]
MTRPFALSALLIALCGCQALERGAQNTVDYVKAARERPLTPMERHARLLAYKPLGTFDTHLASDQDVSCRSALSYPDVDPQDVWNVIAASEQGNAVCQHVQGILYETGRGVTQDFNRAKALYTTATKGDRSAYVELGRMSRDGIAQPVDFVKAREYYKLAGRTGVVGLGELMEQGKGGPEDREGALNLYIDATARYADPAWKAIRPLVAAGLMPDDARREKYNQMWTDELLSTLKRRMLGDRRVRAILETKPITISVQYAFARGEHYSRIYLHKSSGDIEADKAVIRSLYSVSMKDAYLTDDPSISSVVAPFVISQMPVRPDEW